MSTNKKIGYIGIFIILICIGIFWLACSMEWIGTSQLTSDSKSIGSLDIDAAYKVYQDERKDTNILSESEFKNYLFALRVITQTINSKGVDFFIENMKQKDKIYSKSYYNYKIESSIKIAKELFGSKKDVSQFFKKDCTLFEFDLRDEIIFLSEEQSEIALDNYREFLYIAKILYALEDYVDENLKRVLSSWLVETDSKYVSYISLMYANYLMYAEESLFMDSLEI